MMLSCDGVSSFCKLTIYKTRREPPPSGSVVWLVVVWLVVLSSGRFPSRSNQTTKQPKFQTTLPEGGGSLRVLSIEDLEKDETSSRESIKPDSFIISDVARSTYVTSQLQGVWSVTLCDTQVDVPEIDSEHKVIITVR